MPSRHSNSTPRTARSSGPLCYVTDNERDAEALSCQTDCRVVVRPASAASNESPALEIPMKSERLNVPDVQDTRL